MIVLGVDPGSRITGWGIVEATGNRFQALAAGVIRTSERAPLAQRLRSIYRGLHTIIAEYQPAAMAVEEMFYSPRYIQGALKLGHARGVILLSAAEAGLDVHSYTPAVIKRTVAGNGRAEKTQIGRMVQAVLGCDGGAQADATDALAVALTHLNVRRLGDTRAALQI